MKKKIVLLVLVVMTLSLTAFAHDFPPLMRVNQSFIQGEALINEDGVIYIPARQVADVLGIITEWDEASDTAYFYKGEKRIVIKTDKLYTFIDGQPQGEQPINIMTVNWATYLPLDFFVNFFAYGVEYNETLRLIDIDAPDVTVSESYLAPAPGMTGELKYLARIINIEARDASIYKRMAVGNVVLNRVKSANFPDSVYEVVKQRGQFPPAYYDYFDTFEPDIESYIAAMQAYNGHNNIENCLYFNMVPFSWKSQEDYYGEIEGDYFYR